MERSLRRRTDTDSDGFPWPLEHSSTKKDSPDKVIIYDDLPSHWELVVSLYAPALVYWRDSFMALVSRFTLALKARLSGR